MQRCSYSYDAYGAAVAIVSSVNTVCHGVLENNIFCSICYCEADRNVCLLLMNPTFAAYRVLDGN